MADTSIAARPGQTHQVVPNGLLGTIIFVLTQIMFFVALLSALEIVRASVVGAIWPPPSVPPLPISETTAATAVFVASAALLYTAHRYAAADRAIAAKRVLGAVVLGGTFFVFLIGQMVYLFNEGLTLTSSTFGGFYYTIQTYHLILTAFGLGVLWNLRKVLLRGPVGEGTLMGAQVFWYFLVGIWPLLFWKIYL